MKGEPKRKDDSQIKKNSFFIFFNPLFGGGASGNFLFFRMEN